MSGTIAQLGLAVDSSDAVQAATDLERLVQAGTNAEKAADSMAAGFNKASTATAGLASAEGKLSESTDDAMKRLTAMAKASLDSSEYYQTLTTSVNTNATALEKSGSSASSLAALQKKLQAESDALVGTTDHQADAAKKAAAATGVQAEGLQALLGKINPAIAAIQRLDEQQELLNQHFKAGNIKEVDYKAFSADIDAARVKQKGFNDEAGKSGGVFDKLKLGTRQAQENVVQLGNAFSTGDIGSGVRAIAQLGAGAGSSALGLLALVGPIVAVTAVLGALTYAYYQGSEETKDYNNALILTGNYAGTSAGQLSDMARQVSATVGTTGDAAASLAKLAGSGVIAGDSFKEIAEAAAAMEDATGKSVGATIAEFVKIAKDPVSAAKELNDQYHFLTASVYSQIVLLKEQGDTIGAAKLLTDTYADTVKGRAGEITQNLGTIERAWKGITDEARKSLDAIKNIGRDEGPAKRIAELTQSAAYARSALKADPDDTDAKKKLAASEKELYLLQLTVFTGEQRTKTQEDQVRIQKEGIEAEQRLKQIGDSNLTNAEKRDKLTKAYLRDVETLRKANPNDPKVQADYVAKTLENIKDKNKDPKTASASAVDLTAFNAAQNALKEIQADYSNTQKQLDAAQKAGLISQQEYLLKREALIGNERDEVTAAYEAEITALEAAKGKATTTGEQRIQLDQKIADARADMVKAQKAADSELDVLAKNEQGRLKKQELAVQTYTSALQQQVDTLRQQGQRAAAGLGQGDRQRGLTDQQNAIDDKINSQKLDLANQYGDGSRGMSLDEYTKKLAALKTTQQDLHDTVQSNYDQMTAAQGDWSAGASSAWQNYLESARDVAGQTKSLFTNAFSSMEDAIVNFAMTGKLSFADFAKSILADMARIASRQASSGILNAIIGAGTNYFAGGGATGSATAGGAEAGAQGFGSQFDASSASVSFGGGRATGGGVDPNTLYEVNERGPELYSEGGKSFLMTGANGGSVTPLNTGGGPGVAASGGSGGAPQVYINISSDGKTDVSSDQSGLESFGAEIGKFVEQKFKQLEAKSLSPQGNIRKAIQGRG
ncbi:phage tail tape measure protein [Pseudomonas sp. NPDC096950]|uniref:phage tail tape measure protein n=1 Tax=Pseudomonas sp. NPDC096950 TaxID=3364485 RepID=UPI00383A5263